jgi:hypothetical protein
MPNLRSDGKPRSAPVGRVKAASRGSGSAQALVMTRPSGQTKVIAASHRSFPNAVAISWDNRRRLSLRLTQGAPARCLLRLGHP